MRAKYRETLSANSPWILHKLEKKWGSFLHHLCYILIPSLFIYLEICILNYANHLEAHRPLGKAKWVCYTIKEGERTT